MTALNADARQYYLQAQGRKRSKKSLGITLAAYAVGFLVAWLLGLGRGEMEYSDYAGPILVSIGKPEGVTVPAPSAPSVSESVPEAAPPAAPEPTASKNPLPAEPPPPAPAKSAPSKVPESPPPAPTPTVPSTESAPPGPARGEEYGNSHETSFDASEGRVGRALYVPIWTFMPLPRTVEDRVYAKIPGDGFRSAKERQTMFRGFYEYDAGAWRLKADVPVEQRQRLWLMLEDGGYDVTHAGYKEGRSLSPIVIRFRVGPTPDNNPPALESAEIVQSSGDADIDAAVLYGFRRASFSNKSDKSVTGRFTYRF